MPRCKMEQKDTAMSVCSPSKCVHCRVLQLQFQIFWYVFTNFQHLVNPSVWEIAGKVNNPMQTTFNCCPMLIQEEWMLWISGLIKSAGFPWIENLLSQLNNKLNITALFNQSEMFSLESISLDLIDFFWCERTCVVN